MEGKEGSDADKDHENKEFFNNYRPGSSLEAVDAKIAELDAMFKKLCQSAGRALAHHLGEMPPAEPSSTSLLKHATVNDIAVHLKTCRNVIVLTGAGISTSAGIPDFRTPGTGLYDNVQSYLDKYNLPSAQKLFSYELFLKDPEPFYALARELKYPNENVRPTVAHHFIKLLSDKGVLLRNYTQNIDMLQSQTGIPAEKVFEVHGSFRSGTCMKCQAKLDSQQLKDAIFSGSVAYCELSSETNDAVCGGIIKPDIVMFGEKLSQDYLCTVSKDEGKCDLLIIMGTSLSVGPVNKIPTSVPSSTPRLLINMEKVCTDVSQYNNLSAPIFFFDHPDNLTDVFMGGDIDSSVRELVEMVGWDKELEELCKDVKNSETKSGN